MIFSVCDIDLLWLLNWCGNIRPTVLRGSFRDTTVQNMIDIGFVRWHKNSGALALTKKGYQCLVAANVPGPDYCQLSYREDLLQRRLRIAGIALTAYRARLDLFAAELSELAQGRSLFLPHISRGKERNVWGSSRIAAVLRLNDCCYGTYSVYPGVGRLNLEDEEKILSNCVSQSRASKRAFFFTGDSYSSILKELDRRDKQNEGRLISYGEMWEKAISPVHLLSCDATGVVQLQIMAQPNYRERLVRAALNEAYRPPSPDVPVWDAFFSGAPFVIAVDMDLRRLDAAATFHTEGEEIKSIWVFNPLRNWFVLFTPFGLGFTVVIILLICLITKKGYIWFSGYKFIHDPRGFDILPDATHGSSGFLWNLGPIRGAG